MYSLFVLLTLLSYLLFLRAIKIRNGAYFILYSIVSVLLLYTHTYGILVLAAQDLYVLLKWNKYRSVRVPAILCNVFVLLSIAPLFLPAIQQRTFEAGAASRLTWIPAPTISLLLRTIYEYVLPLRHERSLLEVAISFVAAMLFFIAGAAFFAGSKGVEHWVAEVKGLRLGRQTIFGHEDQLLLTLCWFLVPIVLPFAFSKVSIPIYVDRYTISAAPALYVLLAAGSAAMRRVVPEIVWLGALALVIAPGLQSYYGGGLKEQWREVAAFVQENEKGADVVIFAPNQDGWQQKSFELYYRGSLPGCGIDAGLQEDDAIKAAFEKCAAGKQRFWLVMRGPIQRFLTFFVGGASAKTNALSQYQFRGITVYLFQITEK